MPHDTPRPKATEDIQTGSVVFEQRVQHVVELMRDFAFVRGKTAKALAVEWNLSHDYVKDITAEASKRVRASLTSPDELASEVVPGLLRLFRGAVEEQDAKGGASIGNLLADLAGLKSPKRSELSGPDGGPLQVHTGVVLLPPEEDE